MKKVIYLIALLFLSVSVQAQLISSISSQKCFGGTDEELNPSIVKTADGGYAMACWAISTNGDLTANKGSYDIWVTKLNSVGVITWQKNYGGSGRDQSFKIIQLKNGGFLVSGHTLSNDGDISGLHAAQDGLLMKIDPNGVLVWTKCYGGTGEDELFSVNETTDGKFIAVGYTNSADGQVTGNHGMKDLWIIKTDSNGKLLWQKCYGGTLDDMAYATCLATSVNNFFVVGTTASSDGNLTANKGGYDAWMLKIDSSGAILNSINNGGAADDAWRDVIATNDAGCATIGDTKSNTVDVSGNHGAQDIWCGKYNSTYTFSWGVCIGGTASEIGTTIIQLSDNSYSICGYGNSTDLDFLGTHGANDAVIGLVSQTGVLRGTKCYGGGFSEVSSCLVNDGGSATIGTYTMVCTTGSNNLDVSGNHGANDIWFVKLSVALGMIHPSHFNEVKVYPTPINSELNIETDFESFNYSLMDINGKNLVENAQHFNKSLTIQCGDMKPGIYVLTLEHDSNKAIYRIVKQ